MPPHTPSSSSLIAHRGHAAAYIENTLPAIISAIKCGARYIEVDVQLSSDGVAVLFHDRNLQRLAGREGEIADISSSDIGTIELQHNDSHGTPMAPAYICQLHQLKQLMGKHPDIMWFIEIKRVTFKHFSISDFVDTVISTLRPCLDHCTLISFSLEALLHARSRGVKHLGWVLEEWSEPAMGQARSLAPQWLFVDRDDLPRDLNQFPSESWSWVVYEVQQHSEARKLFDMGADLVETFCICELSKNLSDEK